MSSLGGFVLLKKVFISTETPTPKNYNPREFVYAVGY